MKPSLPREKIVDEQIGDYERENQDMWTVDKIYDFLDQGGFLYYCDNNMKDRIQMGVSYLHDLGVSFDGYAGHGRRVVWTGKYLGEDVVVKFCSQDIDKDQQKEEEFVWNNSFNEEDADYFARIIAVAPGYDWLVQEKCTDKQSFTEGDIDFAPEEVKRMAYKYGMRHIEYGYNKEGRLKITDYGGT